MGPALLHGSPDISVGRRTHEELRDSLSLQFLILPCRVSAGFHPSVFKCRCVVVMGMAICRGCSSDRWTISFFIQRIFMTIFSIIVLCIFHILLYFEHFIIQRSIYVWMCNSKDVLILYCNANILFVFLLDVNYILIVLCLYSQCMMTIICSSKRSVYYLIYRPTLLVTEQKAQHIDFQCTKYPK